MAHLQQQPHTVIGADIAKDAIVIANGVAKEIMTITNSGPAIRVLLKRLKPELVVCEATGGYERKLVDACVAAGIACHRVAIHKFKGFVTSLGALAKSDAIDATLLARYGADRWASVPLWREKLPDEEELRALVGRRRDLLALKVAENNRTAAPQAKLAKGELAASFRAMRATIDKQIKAIEAAIAKRAKRQTLKPRIDICTAMNGIGLTTAAALVAIAARTRHNDPPPGRLARRPRTAPQRKREEEGLPQDTRRSPGHPFHFVHAGYARRNRKRRVRQLLQTPRRHRKKASRRYNRRHAKDRRNPQRKDQRRSHLSELMTTEDDFNLDREDGRQVDRGGGAPHALRSSHIHDRLRQSFSPIMQS